MSDDDPDEPGRASDAELGAAVDEAMAAEAKRRFVQRIMGLDRHEGTGRRESSWDEDPPEG